MPTKRAWIFFIIALVLYFLANQTQVGWVYIMTDGLLGLLLVAFFYNLGMLKGVRASRTFHNLSTPGSTPPSPAEPEKQKEPASDDYLTTLELLPANIHEDDSLEIRLEFKHTGLRPALSVTGLELCPFAPPPARQQPFFIPTLIKGQSIALSYQTQADRRGLHQFPPLQLHSNGPFGFFRTKKRLPVPVDILIYPRYHPLKRLRLLERRGFTDRHTRRVGASTEIIGIREYRPGDSLRQVHWRSTARAGKLIVKEFAEQEEMKLAVVLDLQTGSSLGHGKDSTFETAIRLAASFGYYAAHHPIPFHLIGAKQARQWELSPTPLSWAATLTYLAKVKNNGREPLANLLNNLPVLSFVIVLISHPTEAITAALATLPQRGIQTLAVFITPDGDIPSFVSNLKPPALETRSVSPYNWEEQLQQL